MSGTRHFFLSLSLAAGLSAASIADAGETPDAPSTFTLWQLPNQTHTQMMSYVIRTVHGAVIVIDGGMPGDAPYLREFIKGLGNEVSIWFITHPHDDHFNALREILKDPGGMRIGALLGSMPDQAWVKQHAGQGEYESLLAFNKAVRGAGRVVTELETGAEFRIDGLRIEVLGVKNPEITANPINNQSIVFRVSDSAKSVLFTGDLGLQAGDKLLRSEYANRLHSDYVQMAHHGQNGVNKAFYAKVGAKYCLWPTPKWLWDNDKGEGKDSGPWKTLEVRAWMEDLGIERHYVMYEGLQKIE